MKITLYRSSGLPIKPEHVELYFKDLNQAMDNLEAIVGKCTQDNAAEFQTQMEGIHRGLTAKYPISKRIEIPTPSDLPILCEEYGSIAFCLEDSNLVAYILDK